MFVFRVNKMSLLNCLIPTIPLPNDNLSLTWPSLVCVLLCADVGI